ncbi:hypothetical protein Nepgr_006831 [Nepenthes gracilis]|uniref:Uncharacterized protein n=1 Tax=Nepenthes gracilis TaxID=150966 RepID=A0AAD3S5Z3_NEPGR|nr:hypothetical protein Nepgr_006831 [Nepenthes gracilis]
MLSNDCSSSTCAPISSPLPHSLGLDIMSLPSTSHNLPLSADNFLLLSVIHPSLSFSKMATDSTLLCHPLRVNPGGLNTKCHHSTENPEPVQTTNKAQHIQGYLESVDPVIAPLPHGDLDGNPLIDRELLVPGLGTSLQGSAILSYPLSKSSPLKVGDSLGVAHCLANASRIESSINNPETMEHNKSTWASVVQKELSGEGIKLQYFPPPIMNGNVVEISPPREIIQQEKDICGYTLVGNFYDKPLNFYAVNYIARKIWARFGLSHVAEHETGFFFFRFPQ